MTVKGEGKAYKWLVEHKDYPHQEWCLVWPFARDKHGRGMLGYNGESYWAHRFMCQLVKGDTPTIGKFRYDVSGMCCYCGKVGDGINHSDEE